MDVPNKTFSNAWAISGISQANLAHNCMNCPLANFLSISSSSLTMRYGNNKKTFVKFWPFWAWITLFWKRELRYQPRESIYCIQALAARISWVTLRNQGIDDCLYLLWVPRKKRKNCQKSFWKQKYVICDSKENLITSLGLPFRTSIYRIMGVQIQRMEACWEAILRLHDGRQISWDGLLFNFQIRPASSILWMA